jgi:hypothetical protein
VTKILRTMEEENASKVDATMMTTTIATLTTTT